MPHGFFEHTGDIGVRLRAPTLAGVYEAAAGAFLEVVCEAGHIERSVSKSASIVADGPDALLVEWLTELLFWFESERFLPGAATARVAADPAGLGLDVTVAGETFDPARHRIKVLVKGVTYHELAVRQVADGWEATVILDICSSESL
jgi:SHS2 domain-containing protein